MEVNIEKEKRERKEQMLKMRDERNRTWGIQYMEVSITFFGFGGERYKIYEGLGLELAEGVVNGDEVYVEVSEGSSLAVHLGKFWYFCDAVEMASLVQFENGAIGIKIKKR